MGNIALTFSDLRKRLAPDGAIDHIIEVMAQSNPVVNDIPWMQGNLPTGNMTTQRTSLPKGYLRQINRGVPASKSTTKQIVDTCCLLEARSEVDVELLSLQPDAQAFRRSEDDAFVQGMSQQVASYVFYGDSSKNQDEFNGLSVRYNKIGGNVGDSAYQVIDAGGTKDGFLSSAWLVGWGDSGATGIYPKYGVAGIKQEDLGENDAIDGEGNKFRAVTTLFKWKPGLAVRDHRMVSAVRNIDLSKKASADRKNVVEAMIQAQGRMRSLSAGINPVWYVSAELYTMLTLYYSDKNSVYITRAEAQGAMPEMRVNGIIVKKVDALIDTEKKILTV